MQAQASCAPQKYPKETANEPGRAAPHTDDPWHRLLTTYKSEIKYWNVMFYFHTLSQSACETGVEFMAKGRKFLFSHFTDQRDQAVHECLQSPLDPTAKNTDRIQAPATQSLTISALQVSFTFSRFSERVQKLYLIPHFFSSSWWNIITPCSPFSWTSANWNLFTSSSFFK